MRTFPLLSAAVLSVPVICLSADPGAGRVPPVPAAAPAIDQHAGPIQLRSMRAVQDAREKAVKWEQAAEEAVGKLPEKDLQAQVQKRLSVVTPEVAKDLLATPGQVGVVTIAAYRDSDQGEPTTVAVAYEGLGDTINKSFFPRVISDMPQMMRGEGDEPAQPLTLDVANSGYLIYELDKGDLKASYVPQSIMKQSIGLAVQQSRAKTAETAAQQARRDQALAGAASERSAEQQQQAVQASASVSGSTGDSGMNPVYYGSNGYVGNDGGYYNPYGWSPYIVIPSNAADAERRRRESYRDRHKSDQDHDTERDQNQNAASPSGTAANGAVVNGRNSSGEQPSQASSSREPLPAAPPAHAQPQSPQGKPPSTPPEPKPTAPARPAPTPPQPAPTPAPAPPAPRAK